MPGQSLSETPLNRLPARRAEVDWLRGLAVLFMVLWHVVDAWHVPDGRDTRSFAAVVFLAGWAAPMFLFFAGLSLPLAGAARLARGLPRRDIVAGLARRGWQVFLLAHLFRLQSFLLSPGASWSGLLKPDILNVLGLGLVLAALAWGRAPSVRREVIWLLGPTVLVAFVLTPWVRDWWWPTLLHPRLEGYLRISGGNAVFSLFPALAYVFAGTFVGAWMARAPAAAGPRFGLAFAIGAALVALTLGSRYLPLPAALRLWTDSGLIVALRVGALLVVLAVTARLLTRVRLSPADPLIVLGRASLVVYWVHVELAYGNVSYPLHKSLPLVPALAAWFGVMAAMYVLARWWGARAGGPEIVPRHMAAASIRARVGTIGEHP